MNDFLLIQWMTVSITQSHYPASLSTTEHQQKSPPIDADGLSHEYSQRG